MSNSGGPVKGRIIQPGDLFKWFGYKEDQFSSDDPESKVDPIKVISWAFAILIYMKPGDILETSSARFKKISEDLLQIDHNLDLKVLVDELEKRKVIKLPI